MKKGLLLISPYFSPAVGGVETHLKDLCEYFEKRKTKVYVRTYKALGVKNRGKTNENGKYVKIHRMWWPDFGLVFRLENYAILRILYIGLGLFTDTFIFLFKHSKEIETIHVHGFIAALWSLPLAKIFRKKIVIQTHVGFKFDKGSLMSQIIKQVLIRSDKILVLTKNAKAQLLKIGLSEKNIEIYHYWVDKDTFRKINNAREVLKWGKGFYVLFVGRLVEVKGVKTIVKLAKKLQDLTFVVAGSGPLSPYLEEESKKLKNLLFLGKVENSKLPIYYSAADTLLIPSQIVDQTYEEGIPRVMIEALYCGLPVIATPSGGIPDVFDEEIGKMIKDDIGEMVKAIKSTSFNKSELKEVLRYCRSYALLKFGIKNAQIIEKTLTK